MAAEGILRFVAVRPAKLKQQPSTGVSVGDQPMDSPLALRLEQAVVDGADHGRLSEIAGGHETRGAGLDVGPVLAWLDAPEGATLGDAVRAAYGRSVENLVASEDFRLAGEHAANTLVAAAMRGEPVSEDAVRALKAVATVRAVASNAVAEADAPAFAGSTPVRLPAVVRAPRPAAAVESAAESPRPVTDREWLANLEAAHRELSMLALDDTIATGGPRPAAAVEADPTREIPGTVSQARGFLVPGSALDRLSPAARAVTDRLGIGDDQVNLVRAVARVEAEIATTGARHAGPMVAFGGGVVDPGGFRESLGAGGIAALADGGVLGAHSQAGVADLLVVRQKIKAYELGEFAHVENVMAGETRERDTRRLTQIEVITETETQTETEKEKDLSSTERSELQAEAAKTVKDATQIEAGVQVTGSYGPAISFSSSLKAGFASSTEESQRKASSFSQEVTSRTVERVREKVRKLTRQRTLSEFQETNTHKFTNSNPLKHIRGIYRWLNKVYDAQVFNYGQRMMFDFVVPEPAAYFLYALVENPPKDSDLVKPQSPMYLGQPLKPSHLTRTNYHDYVGWYRVPNVPPPPAQFQTISFFDKQDGNDEGNFGRANKLDIPAGYQTIGATVHNSMVFTKDAEKSLHIIVGGHAFDRTAFAGAEFSTIAAHQKELAVNVEVYKGRSFTVGVDVDCSLTSEGLAKWQHQVYDAIIQAYQQQLAEYNQRQAQAQLQQGNKAFGHNPLINQRIVRDEMKRWAIIMLTGKPDLDLGSFTTDKEPTLDLTKTYDHGSFIRFLENAFEWNNILYICYPSFWGRRARWVGALNITDPDPDFAAFLRAGAARVQVPVRPGFEKAVAYYIHTGQIWEGNDVPVIKDDLYVPIIDEITENLGKLDDGVPYPKDSKPWEVTVPTDLVLVQNVDEVPPMRDALTGNPVTFGEV